MSTATEELVRVKMVCPMRPKIAWADQNTPEYETLAGKNGEPLEHGKAYDLTPDSAMHWLKRNRATIVSEHVSPSVREAAELGQAKAAAQQANARKTAKIQEETARKR